MNSNNFMKSFFRQKSIYSSVMSILSLIGLLGFYSCVHEPITTSTGGNTENGGSFNPVDTVDIPINTVSCNPDSIYFSNQVLPIFIANCAISGCHDASYGSEGVVLTSYNSIMRGIRAGDPNHSRNYLVLISSGESLMPRNPGSERGYSLPGEQINLIKKWIQQGARNNYCNECDTTLYTFSGRIKSIIDVNCATSTGCHAAGSAYGNFTNYSGVKIEVDNGLFESNVLIGKTMPPGSPLPACERAVIKKWLDGGALNN